MEKIGKVLNSFYFGSAVFLAAGFYFWFADGHQMLSGAFFGVGLSKFITAVKNQFK